jgi:myo-inositol 2-dehydrogenase/D-chiro-inositol 1-dehydrogenase
VGAGRIGAVHARSAMAARDATVVVVVDPDAERAGRLAELFGADVRLDLASAIARHQPDGIIVASPTELHIEQVALAVAAGIPVLCEKPVSLVLAEVDRCVALVEAAAPPVVMGYHRRFDPDRRRLWEMARSGQLGRIQHMVLNSRDRDLPPPTYLSHSGGMVRDMVVHDLDEVVWHCGTGPLRLAATLTRFGDEALLAEYGDFDSATIVLEFASGPTCHIVASRRSPQGFEQRIDIFGSLGAAGCPSGTPGSVVHADAMGFRSPPLFNGFADRYAPAYQAELEHFIDVIEGRVEPACTVRDARASLALAEAANEAAATKSWVEIETLEPPG